MREKKGVWERREVGRGQARLEEEKGERERGVKREEGERGGRGNKKQCMPQIWNYQNFLSRQRRWTSVRSQGLVENLAIKKYG